jgi:hypothetical protein
MPRKSVSSGLQLLFTPQAFIPFLLGGVAMAVLGNGVYQLLTNWLTTSNSAVIQIMIISLVVIGVMSRVLSYFVNRLRQAPPLVGKKTPDKRKGLIVLVSNKPAASKAVEWHRDSLRWCWLVCSEQSMRVASELKTDLEEMGKQAEIVLVKDVFDPVCCKEKVEAIYATLPKGCFESDVILDFTGMTTPASVGSVLACLDENRSIQYTPPDFDEEMNPKQPRDPIEIVLDWKKLLLHSSGKPKASKQSIDGK